MLSPNPLAETVSPTAELGEPRSTRDVEPRSTREGVEPRSKGPATTSTWSAWFWDAVVLAYFLSGGPLYDPRLTLVQGFSLNQLLGLLTLAHLGWCLLRGPRHRPRALATLVAVGALATLLAVRSIGSANAEYARFKTLAYWLLILPVLLHVDGSLRSREDLRRFLMLWVLAAVSLVLLAIPAVLRIGEGQRLAVLAGGPNVFARLVGCGILCAVLLSSLQWRSGRDVRFWAVALWLPWAGWTLLLSGSKAVLGSLLLAIGAAFLCLGTRRIALGMLALLVCLAAMPLLTHRLIQDRPKDGGIVRLLRLPDVDDPKGSFGSRLGYIESTGQTLRTSPWVGVGTAAWGVSTGRGSGVDYPHNMIMEILAELGIVGFLLVGLPLVWWPRKPEWATRRQGLLSAGLLGLVVFWGLNVQLSGDLVDSRYLWLFLLLFESHWRSEAGASRGRSLWAALPVWRRGRRAASSVPLLESQSRSLGRPGTWPGN